MGCATAHFFGPAPWGPGKGPKGQISLNIIKFQLQSQFQTFFNQTLCVFSQMKDIKHIRWDFHLVAWVMPQRSDLGVLWGVKHIFFEIQPDLVCELLTCVEHALTPLFGSPPSGSLGGGGKRSNIIESESQKQFQRFLNQTWCIYNISDGSFIRRHGSSPGVGLGGTVGGLRDNFFFKIQPDLVCELLT